MVTARHQQRTFPTLKLSYQSQGFLALETASDLAIPQFGRGQTVGFIGGIGTIKDLRFEAGIWTYAIEMILGPEPDMGRIGSETTILLHEADLQEVQ